MSKLDYLFKEIPVDPAVMDAVFAAPEPVENEEGGSDEGRTADVRSRMRGVREAMRSRLTPRQRKCIELYYLRGLSQPQVAGILRIHQTTVSQHIRAGLANLRRALNVKAPKPSMPIISLDRGWGD